MGILNVTPDSFSDGGKYLSPRQAVARALEIQRQGADLVDIGGESTRPGSLPVPAEEEIRRVVPVIRRLAPILKIPISVDTSKARVAEAALQAGASIVNDVTALRDPRMGQVVRRFHALVILMHMQGTPRTMQKNPVYRRLVPEIISDLESSVRKAVSAGIPKSKILIDPGIGFGKKPEQNLQLLKQIQKFKSLGFPVVIGPSRKSFLKLALRDPSAQKLFGTASVVAYAAAHGVSIVRVHDVAAMRQVVDVVDAIRFS